MTRGVRRVETEPELADALAVRRAVFVDEQGVPAELEVDEYDELGAATHFVAYEPDTVDRSDETDASDPIGAARLRPYDEETETAKVERVAVRPVSRGQGWGARLMDAVETTARERGFESVLLHAQSPVEGFYAARGYRRVGEEFEEAGIPHVEMVLDL